MQLEHRNKNNKNTYINLSLSLCLLLTCWLARSLHPRYLLRAQGPGTAELEIAEVQALRSESLVISYESLSGTNTIKHVYNSICSMPVIAHDSISIFDFTGFSHYPSTITPSTIARRARSILPRSFSCFTAVLLWRRSSVTPSRSGDCPIRTDFMATNV